MKRPVITLITAATLALSSQITFADTYIGGGTGPGGSPFSARCAPEEVLVGLALRGGTRVDAVKPICAKAITAESIDQTTIRTGTQWFGGRGGSETSVNCKGNLPSINKLFVSGVTTKKGDFHTIVGVLSIHCGQVSETGTLKTYVLDGYDQLEPNAGHNGEIRREKSTCPLGEVGVGIHGRSGTLLDALGLICGPPILAAAPIPAQPKPKSDKARDILQSRAMPATPPARVPEARAARPPSQN